MLFRANTDTQTEAAAVPRMIFWSVDGVRPFAGGWEQILLYFLPYPPHDINYLFFSAMFVLRASEYGSELVRDYAGTKARS